MAADDETIIRYIYMGGRGNIIPRHVTHFIVHISVKVIPSRAFWGHLNIIEVICHDKVDKVEEKAFYCCPSLRRVIMPGVEIVEDSAFDSCSTLTDVDCGKLELIKGGAFRNCIYLFSAEHQPPIGQDH